jgi:hypothetical protein
MSPIKGLKARIKERTQVFQNWTLFGRKNLTQPLIAGFYQMSDYQYIEKSQGASRRCSECRIRTGFMVEKNSADRKADQLKSHP